MNENIEVKKTFTNKQVLSLLGACAFIVFSGSGIFYRFQAMEEKIVTLEKKIKDDVKNVKDEGKLAFSLIEGMLEVISKNNQLNIDESNRRLNTIRDRQNIRLDKLEESGSDKQQ